MPASTLSKFNQFVQDVHNGVHNLGSHSLKIMLTNTAPAAGNAVKADITEIAAGNGYTAGGPAFTRGLRLIRGDELESVFFGGSDGYAWNPDMMNVAREWVLAFSATLKHPSSRRAVFDASAMALRAYSGRSNGALHMLTMGADPNTKRAAAVFLSFAVHAYEAAKRLQAVAGWSAEGMMDHASRIGSWPETFAARVPRLRAALNNEVW